MSSRSKKSKAKRHKQKAAGVLPKEPLFRKARRKIFAAIGLMASLLAFLSIIPRISVSEPSSLADPKNMMSGSFVISNTGYIPLDDVSVEIWAGYISSPNPGGQLKGELNSNGAPKFNAHFQPRGAQHHYLGPDEKITINPETQFSGEIARADIAIAVYYQPWFIPIRRKNFSGLLPCLIGQVEPIGDLGQ